MSNVYYIPYDPNGGLNSVRDAAVRLLHTVQEKESIDLCSGDIPLKVHFGEKGNHTWLKPETYDGIIDDLKSKGCNPYFVETSVLYGGERFSRDKHLKLAEAHGFTRIPVVIADGARGEEAVNLPVPNGHHFKTAAIAKVLADAPQVIVLSHFKGHALAGFGGAIKQLSMGFAAKGGKMAMHLGVKPRIINLFCKHCGLCMKRCNEGAIVISPKSKIDHSKCVGCGACFSICPHHAVSIFTVAGFWNALFRGKFFREKLVEYAAASHAGRKNIYISFAVNITKGCDCEPRPMRFSIPDIGVLASADPVALDAACWSLAAEKGLKFRGREQLDYAEKIGLGSSHFTLITPEAF